MKKSRRLNSYFRYHFLPSFIVVIICTLIISLTSYHVLQDSMVKWLTENNRKVLDQYSDIINNIIISNSSDIYKNILSNMLDDDRMKYYMHSPLDKNMLDTLHISTGPICRNILCGK